VGAVDDDRVGLPIKLGPCSNGEYVPAPPTDLVLEAARRAREACDDNARRTGISRRDFLLSICGAATTLSVLAACSKEKSAGKEVGGTFTIPPEATTETTAAREAIGGDGFVMDVQTHFLEYDETNATQTYWGTVFPQSRCGEDDSRDCFSTGRFRGRDDRRQCDRRRSSDRRPRQFRELHARHQRAANRSAPSGAGERR
jgi:hypothetical protein